MRRTLAGIVQVYEDIDYEIVAASIDRARRDSGRFLDVYVSRIDEEE